jgi:hypothetical protein
MSKPRNNNNNNRVATDHKWLVGAGVGGRIIILETHICTIVDSRPNVEKSIFTTDISKYNMLFHFLLVSALSPPAPFTSSPSSSKQQLAALQLETRR